MVLGDPQHWKDRFVTLDERFLDRILHHWPSCIALLPGQPEEDAITINIIDLLSRDAIVRRICHFVSYQHEPFGTNPGGAKFSKGKIDIAVLVDRERERYLAYECKRLNVISNGVRSSLATRYVKDGMMRFLTEQYAEGLPVGCMLGYVMDGDISFALKQVGAAIEAEKLTLGLVSGPTTGPAAAPTSRFTTRHNKASNSSIELRHILMPFAVSAAVASVPTTETISAAN